MLDISLRQLEYFVAVVEEGSVTEAARKLRVSPGGISLAVSQLEATLDLQLTLRIRGRGASLTTAGRWVYQQAIELLEQSNRIRTASRALRGELVGPLRLGCFDTLSPWLLPRIAAHFSNAHPGVDLQLVEGVTNDLHQQLKNGEIDAAILYESHLQTGVVGTEILSLKVQVALPTGHPLAGEPSVHLADLKDESSILLDVPPAMTYVERMMENAGVHTHVRWRSRNVETIRSMVARGLGYSIIMGRPFSNYSYDGLPIVYKDIADEILPSIVVVAIPEGLEPTEKISSLIKFCMAEFAGDTSLNGEATQ